MMADYPDSENPSMMQPVKTQLLVVIPLALVITLLRNGSATTAGSALLGCFIALAVSNWFYWKAIVRAPATDKIVGAEHSLLTMYAAEFSKLALAALLLGASFKFSDVLHLDKFALLLAFCIAWIVQAVTSAYYAAETQAPPSEPKDS